MAGVKVNFSVDSSQVNQGLNNVKNKIDNIKNSGGQTGSSMNSFADSMDNAVRALDSVAGACGMASTGFSGLAGDLISLATNPVALTIAALGALTAAAISVYDSMTQNGEQWMAQIQAEMKAHQAKSAMLQKQLQMQVKYFDRLKQLGKEQRLSNAQRIEAGKIIDILSGKYKNLGLGIDAVTGKITGLDNAQKEFLRQQALQKIADLDKQLTGIDHQIVAAMVSDVPGEVGTDVIDYLAGAGYTHRTIKADRARRDGLGITFKHFKVGDEAGDINSSNREKANALLDLWNSGQTDKRIQFLTEILKNPKIANDKDVLQSVTKVLQFYIQRSAKIKQKKTLMEQTDLALKKLDSDTQTVTQAVVKATIQKNEQEQKRLRQQVAKEQTRTQELLQKYWDDYERQKYDSLATTDEKIKFLEDKVKIQTDLYKKHKDLIRQKQFQWATAGAKQSETYLALQKETDPNKKLLLEQKLSELTKKRLALQIQLEKLEQKHHLMYRQKEKFEKEITKLKEQQKKVQAQKQKAEAEKNKKLQEQFKKSVIDDAKKIQQTFFNKFGAVKGLTTAAQKIVQAEKKLGRSLTQEQKNQLIKIEQLEKAMASLGGMGLGSILKTQTNALTARGGWDGGVRSIDEDAINKRIADQATKQTNLLTQIRRLVQNVGRI